MTATYYISAYKKNPALLFVDNIKHPNSVKMLREIAQDDSKGAVALFKSAYNVAIHYLITSKADCSAVHDPEADKVFHELGFVGTQNGCLMDIVSDGINAMKKADEYMRIHTNESPGFAPPLTMMIIDDLTIEADMTEHTACVEYWESLR